MPAAPWWRIGCKNIETRKDPTSLEENADWIELIFHQRFFNPTCAYGNVVEATRPEALPEVTHPGNHYLNNRQADVRTRLVQHQHFHSQPLGNTDASIHILQQIVACQVRIICRLPERHIPIWHQIRLRGESCRLPPLNRFLVGKPVSRTTVGCFFRDRRKKLINFR